MFRADAEVALTSASLARYRGKVQLIFTSPPFPLNRKKQYGNRLGEEYVQWLSSFAAQFREFLKPDGSIVLEMGNAWESGKPAMSTLALRALLAFLDAGNFSLCQQFVCYNPARLPTPVQWVNIERIRVKDAFTHLWWMSPSPRPKADNRAILHGYSSSMRRLLASKKYNAGRRPSQHFIGKSSFLTDNRGAIPSNVLTVANTSANDEYLTYCRRHKLELHPARMPAKVPEFFINFLTAPRDIVLDPFAGSNTTGATADKLKRRWLSIEANPTYVQGSKGRFQQLAE
jgi:site-specific DNA-methyltransferase (cytosine-N4-specific)